MTNFDVLVVYSESLAHTATNKNEKHLKPFAAGSANESYNIVYGYFMEICNRMSLKAAFTTSADIIGPGICNSFWLYSKSTWKRVDSQGYSALIFDKFSPTRVGIKLRRELLFSSSEVKPFNDPELFKLFFDKQLTYNLLGEFAIPTISIDEKTVEGVTKACKKLIDLTKKHPQKKDFGEEIVMKDRYGAGGRHIHKFDKDQIEKMLAKNILHKKVSYIIQPFAKFDKGYEYQKTVASTDIRLIYLGGEIVQSYIRRAKIGDFRCNEHQGGLLTYLPVKSLPRFLVDKSNQISKLLNKKCSLFTLDFIISNNGNAYLLEGNTGPGLDWNMSLKKNTFEAKKLIRLVVAELKARTEVKSILTTTPVDYKSILSNESFGYPAVI